MRVIVEARMRVIVAHHLNTEALYRHAALRGLARSLKTEIIYPWRAVSMWQLAAGYTAVVHFDAARTGCVAYSDPANAHEAYLWVLDDLTGRPLNDLEAVLLDKRMPTPKRKVSPR